MLGEEWKNLSAAEREVFEARKAADVERYEQEVRGCGCTPILLTSRTLACRPLCGLSQLMVASPQCQCKEAGAIL